MKRNSTIKKLIAVGLIVTATGAIAQSVIYKGLRVPQLETATQGNIVNGSSSNDLKEAAKGQQVFNLSTGTMQYWDGAKWIDFSTTATDQKGIEKAGGKYGIVITGSGTDSIGVELPAGDATKKVLVWNTTNSVWEPNIISAVIQETLTSLTSNGSGTLSYKNEEGNTNSINIRTEIAAQIHDSIANHPQTVTTLTESSGVYTYTNEAGTTTQINIPALIHDSLATVSANSNLTALTLTRSGNAITLGKTTGTAGQFLAQDGTWQTPANTEYTADESTITKSGGNQFSVPTGGITTAQILDATIAWADLSQPVKDSIKATVQVDTIAARGGLTINKSKAGNDSVYKVGLIEGTTNGQVLKWNATTSRWELAPATAIKRYTVTIDADQAKESKTYSGTTTIATPADLNVISILPTITTTEAGGDDFIAENYDISYTVKKDGSNIKWMLRIKSDNFDASKKIKVAGVTINYTSESETLSDGTSFTARTFVGQ